MDKQLEFDFGRTKDDIINALRNNEGELRELDNKINVIEGLMRNAEGAKYDEYQSLISELSSKKDKLEIFIAQDNVELNKLNLKEAYIKANHSQVAMSRSQSKREYDDIVLQIKRNSEKAENFKREEMIFEGKKLDKHSEISNEQEKSTAIKDKLTTLKEKKENFVKLNGNYDLETVRSDLESYKTWIAENNGKIEIINKYLKLREVSKEVKVELKRDKEIILKETKDLKEEIKSNKAVEKNLVKEDKVDAQIVRAEKRIGKKAVTIEKLREEAVGYREKELYNQYMYNNLLGSNQKLREKANKLKEKIEDLGGEISNKANKEVNENKINPDENKTFKVNANNSKVSEECQGNGSAC